MCFFNRRRTLSWPDAAGAMAGAAADLEQVLDTVSTGKAGVLVRPTSEQVPEQSRAEVERALGGVSQEHGHFEVRPDESGYPWIVIEAEGLVALAAEIQSIGAALGASGLGERVLAAVYQFSWKDQTIYWIYQPRLGAYTPFAPVGDPKDQERDHPLELRMEQATRRNLPTAKDIAHWYPVWGMPF